MIINKKFMFVAILSTACLSICTMAGKYIFIKNVSFSMNGKIDIVNREFYDIILKAGYYDTTCIVKDLEGNDVSQSDAIKYFVENEDVEDSNGNHFVKLKKYYVNMTQDSDGVMVYKLSTKKLDDTYFVCPYFKDKDGNEIDYAYYGKYKGYVKDSKLYSISGVTPTYSVALDTFRAYARANGEQYHQTDWCAAFTTQIMCMCTYKTTQSNNILTYRRYSSNTGSGTLILGIEDIVGNGLETVDGVIFRSSELLSDCSVSWADKISDYTNELTTNQTILTGATNVVSGTSSGYISKKYYINDKPALSLFPKEVTASSSTYYCDNFYYNDNESGPYLVIWGANYSFQSDGLFQIYCNNSLSNTLVAKSIYTTRLHAKILS